MSIGDRVREAREAANLKPATLAKKVGISRSAIGQIESGDTKRPNAENFVKIARVLGVCTKWLLYGTGPMMDAEKKLPTGNLNPRSTQSEQQSSGETTEGEMLIRKTINILGTLNNDHLQNVYAAAIREQTMQEAEEKIASRPMKERA